jgi:hypothetical protein
MFHRIEDFSQPARGDAMNPEQLALYQRMHPSKRAPAGFAAVYVEPVYIDRSYNKRIDNGMGWSNEYVERKPLVGTDVIVADANIIKLSERRLMRRHRILQSNAGYEKAVHHLINSGFVWLEEWAEQHGALADLESTYRDVANCFGRG